jgi:hypothetical protein
MLLNSVLIFNTFSKDANRIQQIFSSEKVPTLWRALPAIEELLTAWENKANSLKYAVYAPGLQKGIDKIRKYYSRFDEKPAYILALGNFLKSVSYQVTNCTYILVLHPYFKLTYIKMAWGGAEEQAAEIAAGNTNAKNWQDEARKVVEQTVSSMQLFPHVTTNAHYRWRNTGALVHPKHPLHHHSHLRM